MWKDVADHSREFIKEYLETFPMVRTVLLVLYESLLYGLLVCVVVETVGGDEGGRQGQH